MKYAVLLIACASAQLQDIVIQPNFGTDWGYSQTTLQNGDQLVPSQPFDPAAWPSVFADTCGGAGNTQSPIALGSDQSANQPGVATEELVADIDHFLNCRSLRIADFTPQPNQALPSVNVTNIGYTLEIMTENPFDFELDGVPEALFLDARANQNCDSGLFLLDRINLRFGNDNNLGTEHTIDGQSGVLETQALYFREDLQDFFTVNTNLTDGTPIDTSGINPINSRLVVNTLFQIGEANPALQTIVDEINNNGAIAPGQSRVLQFSPTDLIGDQSGSYFLYNGSLSIPTCSQDVRQLVFNNFETISQDQLNTLRTLVSGAQDNAGNNLNIAPNLRSLNDNSDSIVYANRFLLTADYKLNVIPAWVVSGLYFATLVGLLVRWGIITKGKNNDKGSNFIYK